IVLADKFRYTSEGNAITIKGIDDVQQFLAIREALALDIENKIQISIFHLLSAIFHLKNVIINEDNEESSFIKESDKEFSIFCSLI
ncbi:unnamed protein product, partial [Rotaria sp. Silwood2]